jgi:hypothetical protein
VLISAPPSRGERVIRLKFALQKKLTKIFYFGKRYCENLINFIVKITFSSVKIISTIIRKKNRSDIQDNLFTRKTETPRFWEGENTGLGEIGA